MKNVFVLILGMALFGCATPIHYTAKQKCAQDGMALVGVDHGSSNGFIYGSGSATAYGANPAQPTSVYSNSSVFSRGSSEYVRCAVPATDAEKSEITAIQTSLAPINEYNSNIRAKRAVTGIGYFFWVIPGLGAKLYYDSEYDKALRSSGELLRIPAATQATFPAN